MWYVVSCDRLIFLGCRARRVGTQRVGGGVDKRMLVCARAEGRGGGVGWYKREGIEMREIK